MCGICGEINYRGLRDGGVARMLATLRHRGPDDEGLWSEGPAALGHTRLSIIDLDTGHQPVGNETGSIQVVLNGEIYNYEELRRGLIERGHQFKTHSDTEVIAHLYEERGVDCLAELRGMFAFALWDADQQRLFAARDHLGQKPFFYVDEGHSLAFGSEIKSLLALDPSLREMDPEALNQYLTLRIITPPRSMFRRVRKLPPAHFLTFDAKRGLEIQRYWDLRFEPKISGSDDDLVDALEERIIECLRPHMVSDVPVGAFLSGGFDSTLVVAMLMKHVLREPLQTFTIGLPYGEHDEAPYARMVAEQYGTLHHEKVMTPSLVAHLPDLVWHLDEPSDPLSVCSYLIAKMAREHVKVVLGGDGGDELFGGYDRYYGNVYADYYGALPRSLRAHVAGPLLGMLPDGGWYKSVGHQMKWLHRLSFWEGGERYARSLGYFYFDEERRAQLYGDGIGDWRSYDPDRELREAYENAPASSPVDRMLYADSQLRLSDHSVMILDRMTMAHGLEARSPFMDPRLAEFSAQLPVRMKVRGRKLRWIQRRLVERYLPKAVVDRPKQGFSSALPYMLRDEYRLLFDRFLKDSQLARDGILRGDSIAAFVADHSAGRADHGNRLWLLLNSEIWYRMFMGGETRETLHAQIAGTDAPEASA